MTKQDGSQKWTIILFTIGVFMAGLDNGIISAALTTIYQSFHVSPTWGTWTVTIYTLGIALAVPIVGKLSDNYGRKRLFIIETTIFMIGSLLVAVSPNFTFLLIARFLQALGGGGIFIIATSHVLATVPKENQGKILGILGGMHGISAVIGPNIGSAILHITGTWQWMFLINIPIGLFIGFMAFSKMTETKQPTSKALDTAGLIYLSLSIVALMYGITQIDSLSLLASVFSMSVLPFIIIGFLMLGLFLWHEQGFEQRGGDPIIAISLIRKKSFVYTLLLGFLSGGFLATIIFTPSFAQQVLQIPAESAGFWLTPLAIASTFGAGFGGVLTDRIGAARTIMFASIVGITGFSLFYIITDEKILFVVASLLAGLGLGFLLGAPLNVLIGASVEKHQYGTAVGTLSLMRQMGLVLFPTIFASFITSGVVRMEQALQTSFSDVMATFSLQSGEADYGDMMGAIGRVSDAQTQTNMLTLAQEAMKSGFAGMFVIAIMVAILVLIISLYFQKNYQKLTKKTSSHD